MVACMQGGYWWLACRSNNLILARNMLVVWILIMALRLMVVCRVTQDIPGEGEREERDNRDGTRQEVLTWT